MSDKLSDPIEIFEIEGEDSMRVLMRHNEDRTQVHLMIRFSSPPEFGDLLVGLSAMIDELLENGENRFPIHATGARH
jgi:hypothetical protein